MGWGAAGKGAAAPAVTPAVATPAATPAKGGGKGGGKGGWSSWGGSWSLPDNVYWIGKQIGQLNKSGTLQKPIMYNDVIEVLGSINEAAAMGILKQLADKAAEVKDPTGWLKTAGMKQMNAEWTGQRSHNGGSNTLSKAIGELNKSGVLVEPIHFTEVVGPLSCMNEAEALALIAEVQANAATIKAPTGWLKGAAGRSARKTLRDNPY
eukprot:gnl/TRDRNA2_/TRDRNA2_184314_c0_seq1.p1 gnl/TRDRNA2_/TRDRNA2_184314_c0~~gnl/TRDRNA2_/TRDRNA2_184314_c0_seq1.p1  ORF type:complete len:208 (+),score=37.07 gnl/TRDRNA2_/TRDRNA2_184314_c0_seq1:62-685(+)